MSNDNQSPEVSGIPEAPGGQGPAGQEPLAVDARLLSEAVIEFNISRKNVGLYPPGHVRITNAIDSAYGHILKLFEFRASITLGITKNSLIIDNKALDSRNPVYRECARSFHDLGIAGITFQSGLEKDELVKLHEIMTRKDPPTGKEIVEAAREAGISRLRLSPLDHSSFKFVTGKTRGGPGVAGGGDEAGPSSPGRDATEDYVYGLLEGKLAAAGAGESEMLLGLDPAQVAAAIEKSGGKAEESYDRVISAYLAKTDRDRLSPASLQKLVGMMDNLTEDVRQKFLSRASTRLAVDVKGMEQTIRNMGATELEKITAFFAQNAKGLPDSLKNVIDKLSTLTSSNDSKFSFDGESSSGHLVHDIDLSDAMKNLFSEDNFESYVTSGYTQQLEDMLAAPVEVVEGQIKGIEQQCHPDVVDRVAAEVMLEVIHHKSVTQGEYLGVITGLTKQSTEFVETGRFDEALNIYNVIYAQTFGGAYEHEARSTIEYYFKSPMFVSSVLFGSRLWGRTNREGITRLIRALSDTMVPPLLDELAGEPQAAARKYFIKLLADVGDLIMPEVVKRLDDNRWYVKRNMLLLVRLAGSAEQAGHALPFVRHEDGRIVHEALAVLLKFGHKQAVPYLRSVLNLTDLEKRGIGVRLAAMFKVRAVVKELTTILMKKDALGDEDLYRPAVIKALGQIGDPQAVPFIAKVLAEKSLLKRGQARATKKAAFESLIGYPPDTVRTLVEAGANSGDEEFSAICQRHLRSRASKGGE